MHVALLALVIAAAPASSQGGGVLRGVVMSADDRAPAPAAEIRVPGRAAVVADAQGSFLLEGVPAGDLELEALAQGHRSARQGVSVPPGGEVSVLVVLSRLPAPGRVRGRVTGKDGLPLAGAEVKAGARSAIADADGGFLLEQVGPGPVTLDAGSIGYKPLQEVVVVPSRGEASIALAMQKLGAGSLAIIRGKVRSVAGAPLRAVLRVAEARILARTRSDGSFEIRLPGGQYTVSFEAPGFFKQSKAVSVDDGDQALFYVDLSPRAR